MNTIIMALYLGPMANNLHEATEGLQASTGMACRCPLPQPGKQHSAHTQARSIHPLPSRDL